jgi:type IV secretory pathway VirB10-like protein
MRESEMHLFAAVGAIALSAALAVPTVLMGDAKADTTPPLENMEAIEASLAYKKPNAPKQPQKQKAPPPPEVKPEGVSHDENKKPDETKKPDEKKDKPPDKPIKDPLKQFQRQDPDQEPGDTTPQIGSFDGSQFGIGDVTKGDPYFQRLVVDLAWSSPELAKSGAAAPVGCIHINADGKIPEFKFQVKGDDDIATLAETALRELKQKRNDKPEEVPTHLLKQLTTRWVCFKFTVKSSE